MLPRLHRPRGIAVKQVRSACVGPGQLVDAAMIKGAALLATMMWGMRAANRWSDDRGVNVLELARRNGVPRGSRMPNTIVAAMSCSLRCD